MHWQRMAQIEQPLPKETRKDQVWKDRKQMVLLLQTQGTVCYAQALGVVEVGSLLVKDIA